MKAVILTLCALLLATCGGNRPNKKQQPVNETVDIQADIQEDIQVPARKTADSTVVADILRQLPAECLPGPAEECISALAKSVWHNHIAERIKTEEFCWDEYAYSFFPYKDSDAWLVLYLMHDGYDASFPEVSRAFRYQDGRLRETGWPFEQPSFEDFANGLVEALLEPEKLEKAQMSYRINYKYDQWEEVLTASMCADTRLDAACRTIEYRWDGERFLRTDGRFKMVNNRSFGPFWRFSKLKAAPRGFSYQEESLDDELVASLVHLVEDKTGETIADFLLDTDERILEMQIYSSEYMGSLDLYPGGKLGRKWQETTSHSLYSAGDDVILCVLGNEYRLPLSAVTKGTPGENGWYKKDTWDLSPDAIITSVIVPYDSSEDKAPAKVTRTLMENIVRQLPEECLPKFVEDGAEALMETWRPEEPEDIVWGRTMGDVDGEGITVHLHPYKEKGKWLVIYLHHMGQYRLGLLSNKAFQYKNGQLTEIPWPIKDPSFEDFTKGRTEGLVDPEYLETIQEEWSINYDYIFSTDEYITASLLFFDEADFFDDDYNPGGEAFCDACRRFEYHWDGEQFVRKVKE